MEQTIEYKGYTIEVSNDEDPMDPRVDWDNLGTMVCFHGRYNLGDKTDLNVDQFSGWDELEEYLVKKVGAVVILPLYLIDHSGLAMNTTGFGCPWDSGQVGFIYATRKDIRENFMKTKCTKKLIEQTEKILKCEVKIQSAYINGDVSRYNISNQVGEDIDGCGGWYDDDEAMEAEYKSVVDNDIKYMMEKQETFDIR